MPDFPSLFIRAHKLYALLLNGEDPDTGNPLSDDAVISTLQEYISTEIDLMQVMTESAGYTQLPAGNNPQLDRLRQIRDRGPAGLLLFCRQVLDSLPDNTALDFESIWIPIQKRWLHYEEIIRQKFP